MSDVSIQRWVTGGLLLALVVSRLAVAWPHMSTRSLPVPTDARRLGGDAVTYDMPAYNLLAGHGYSSCLAPPYEPSVMRTPTYPLALAATYSLFGRNAAAVVGMNVLFDLAAVVLLFAVARRLLPPWWAVGFLAITVALAPWSDFLGQRLSESLTALLLAASLWLLARTPSVGRWLALGLCLGALVMCRPVYALLPVAIAAWSVTSGHIRLTGGGGWVMAALFAGVLALWAPWVARNAVSVNRFIPLSPAGSGLTLWLGTWYEKPPYWYIKRNRHGIVERTIPDYAFSSPEERARVVPQFERYIELYFSNGGVEMIEPDTALRQIAIEKIRAEPLHWIALRARATLRMLGQQYLAARVIGNRTLWRIVAWSLGVLSLLGVFISISRRSWQPLTVVFLYTWLIHFPTHGEPRYLAPAYGAAMLLAVLALHWLVHARNHVELLRCG